uniref:Uncharacterized protein n=1 Tax=Caloglossa monosticha TaxID=76906 RepID=A0A1Z1M4N0_9FLOR|nr:hypothetical protein [Caloglossa monosticha]ARW61018.1 hypothetical protein [Caloglossa monosticha]
MYSYLQDFYKAEDSNENIDNFDILNSIEKDNTPIGWSSICFDETIHFYSDILTKRVKE